MTDRFFMPNTKLLQVPDAGAWETPLLPDTCSRTAAKPFVELLKQTLALFQSEVVDPTPKIPSKLCKSLCSRFAVVTVQDLTTAFLEAQEALRRKRKGQARIVAASTVLGYDFRFADDYRFCFVGDESMTTARFRLVDTNVTRWYHCISRCVRSAWLLQDDGTNNRKDWIDQRLKELDQIFAISVGGFSIMDNHLHILLRIDDEQAKTWSPLEVAKRWTRLFPPRGVDRKPMKPTDEFLQLRANNLEWVEEARKRLASLGWFMKCLKEPLSRMANKQDECKGAFFEGRYKSIAILDEEALLTVCAYIDLNPVAAGIVSLPEESPHTSIKERVDHAKSKGRMCDVAEIRNGSVAASKVSGKVEKGLWLIPIEDRRKLGEEREGMREGFTFGQYLLLVDYTSRTIRKGKASVSKELEGIFERLGSSAESWSNRVKKLLAKPWMGRFLSASRDRLRALASKLGVRHLANIG